MQILAFIILALLVWFFWSLHSSKKKFIERLRIAKENYENSLYELKKDPANADLKQVTLELGRSYSSLTRDNNGVTTVDEVALMNDINAACAAASSINPLSTSQSIEDRLNNLSNLLEKGVISQLEYDSRRKEILDSI